MLSESTAQACRAHPILAEPEWVRIKGAHAKIRARRLVAISPRDGGGRGDDRRQDSDASSGPPRLRTGLLQRD